MEFYEYILTSEALCSGERIKAGNFRPCARTIRYSQITGALKRLFGNGEIHSVGYLDELDSYNCAEYLIYSPRERVSEISKVPLQIETLTNVRAKIFILKNSFTENLPERFELTIGALISKGLGHCQLSRVNLHSIDLKRKLPLGKLKIRIPEKYAEIFGIRKIVRPIYGYLFEPVSISYGHYVRSLFEGSFVEAPEIFISQKKGGS